jgi:hypothetical protein
MFTTTCIELLSGADPEGIKWAMPPLNYVQSFKYNDRLMFS